MKSACSWGAGLVRWAKFNVVGAIGVLLQLALIVLFTRVLRFPYLVATFIAVELTVLHNFAWHERYTIRGAIVEHCQESRQAASRDLYASTRAMGWCRSSAILR